MMAVADTGKPSRLMAVFRTIYGDESESVGQWNEDLARDAVHAAINTCYAISRTPDRDRSILRAVLLDKDPVIAVAKEHDLTVTRIRQIARQGVRLLRHPARSPLRMLHAITGEEWTQILQVYESR